MAVWTILTTSVTLIILGVPGILAGIVERKGRALYRIGVTWAWFVFKLNRVKLKVVGAEKLVRTRSYVFISNHLSHLDGLAAVLAMPHTLRFVAKKSLARVPVFGWAFKLARMIFIDRGDSAGAIETINRSARELRNGVSAFFFAEGTRSASGEMRPFKKGGVSFALKAQLPIVPVTIINSNRLLPKGALAIKKGIIRVIVGDPIEIAPFSEKYRDRLLSE
ncbi:MAG TPA: 1-acyl-sn-glycerol-3-phosphate acyltransferase, partial [Spirochaetes bacterium]|nr:1-acyl-sn-glycerol-3-phosphate acyltransferase [Spirochaetota bacterium]